MSQAYITRWLRRNRTSGKLCLGGPAAHVQSQATVRDRSGFVAGSRFQGLLGGVRGPAALVFATPGGPARRCNLPRANLPAKASECSPCGKRIAASTQRRCRRRARCGPFPRWSRCRAWNSWRIPVFADFVTEHDVGLAVRLSPTCRDLIGCPLPRAARIVAAEDVEALYAANERKCAR
jgi:hypothetical protein